MYRSQFISDSYITSSYQILRDNYDCIDRPCITSKLLQDRKILRAIIAPVGYGKTSIIFNYLRTVYSFKKSFVIDCSYPSFLRDLDNDVIDANINSIESSTNIVIFDDLPELDDVRTLIFSKTINKLLDSDIEVIITAQPNKVNVDDLCDNSIVLNAIDLLTTNEEFVNYDDIQKTNYIDLIKRTKGVPQFVYSEIPFEFDQSILNLNGKEKELFKYMYIMFLLCNGKFSDIAECLHLKNVKPYMVKIHENYPHFGINIELETFDTIEFDVNNLISFLKSGGKRTLTTKFEDSNAIYLVFKNLIEQNKLLRASQLIRAYFCKGEQLKCIYKIYSELFNSGYSSIILNTTKHFDGKRIIRVSVQRCLSMIAAYDLADQMYITALDNTIQKSQAMPYSFKLFSHIIRCVNLRGESYHHLINDCLNLYLKIDENDEFNWILKDLFTAKDVKEIFDFFFLLNDDILKASLLLFKKVEKLETVIKNNESTFSIAFCLNLYISFLKNYISGKVGIVNGLEKMGIKSENAKRVEELLSCIIDCLKGIIVDEEIRNLSCPWFISKVIMDIVEFCKSKFTFRTFVTNCDVEQFCELANTRKRLNVSVYNVTYEDKYEIIQTREITTSNISSEKAESVKHDAVVVKNPILFLNFFGGFSAYIGNKEISKPLIRNKRTIALLYILLAYGGKGANRDYFIDLCWGEGASQSKSTVRNFYNTMTRLNEMIGICKTNPYISNVRNYGYTVNESLVKSDLDKFEDMVSSLIFNNGKNISWKQSYRDILNKYSKPLLPGFTEYECIINDRLTYKNRLLDAIVAASDKLIYEQENMGALWLIRLAHKLDDTREDVYYKMMQIQSTLHQRSAAVASFFECKKNMEEKLGLSPSKDIRELYDDIVRAV